MINFGLSFFVHFRGEKLAVKALLNKFPLSKFELNGQVTYKDLVESIFNSLPEDDDKDSNYKT